MARSTRDQPRWFVPVLFGGMLIAVAVLAGLGALLYDPAHETLKVGDRTFVIPPSEISSLTRDPHLFVRIRLPDRPFEIAHDARAASRRDRTGVPHIFSVNDHGEHDVWYARDGRSLVACRRATTPIGGCGTWVSYGGVTWSILFPESRIGEADSFAREAVDRLNRYDTSSRRLLR